MFAYSNLPCCPSLFRMSVTFLGQGMALALLSAPATLVHFLLQKRFAGGSIGSSMYSIVSHTACSSCEIY